MKFAAALVLLAAPASVAAGRPPRRDPAAARRHLARAERAGAAVRRLAYDVPMTSEPRGADGGATPLFDTQPDGSRKGNLGRPASSECPGGDLSRNDKLNLIGVKGMTLVRSDNCVTYDHGEDVDLEFEVREDTIDREVLSTLDVNRMDEWRVVLLMRMARPVAGSDTWQPITSVTPSFSSRRLQAAPQYQVGCGQGTDCREGASQVAGADELHEVRCCSDTEKPGWIQSPHATCGGVWSQSELEGCHEVTYAEAAKICREAGHARLCTLQELTGSCTKGAGCDFDHQLLWSSTTATPAGGDSGGGFGAATVGDEDGGDGDGLAMPTPPTPPTFPLTGTARIPGSLTGLDALNVNEYGLGFDAFLVSHDNSAVVGPTEMHFTQPPEPPEDGAGAFGAKSMGGGSTIDGLNEFLQGKKQAVHDHSQNVANDSGQGSSGQKSSGFGAASVGEGDGTEGNQVPGADILAVPAQSASYVIEADNVANGKVYHPGDTVTIVYEVTPGASDGGVGSQNDQGEGDGDGSKGDGSKGDGSKGDGDRGDGDRGEGGRGNREPREGEPREGKPRGDGKTGGDAPAMRKVGLRRHLGLYEDTGVPVEEQANEGLLDDVPPPADGGFGTNAVDEGEGGDAPGAVPVDETKYDNMNKQIGGASAGGGEGPPPDEVDPRIAEYEAKAGKYVIAVMMSHARAQGSVSNLIWYRDVGEAQSGTVSFEVSALNCTQHGTGFDIWVLDGNYEDKAGPAEFTLASCPQ